MPMPEYEGQPMDDWKCPLDTVWLTRTDFEERQWQWEQANPHRL
jgi:hypothetical protein